MTHATLSVNEQGRVLIPAQLRQELRIRPGSSLVAYVEDGRLILEDRDHLAARLQREALDSRTTSGSVVDELITDRRSESAREQSEMEEPGQRAAGQRHGEEPGQRAAGQRHGE